MSAKRMGLTHLECEQLEDRLVLDAASFVTALYNSLLSRAPESAGLNFWIGQIQDNGLSNQQVATDIWRSTEHRQDEVTSYYETYLHRAADASGLAFWTGALVNGQFNEEQVETLFMSSPEYANAHSTPAAFVLGTYLDVLGRLPSSIESISWETQLTSKGAESVAASILTSTESYTRILDNYYQTYLGRAIDATGLNTWLTELESASGTVESVAEGILGSAEYANLASNSSSGFGSLQSFAAPTTTFNTPASSTFSNLTAAPSTGFGSFQNLPAPTTTFNTPVSSTAGFANLISTTSPA